ncbi:MAG: acyl-CoA dehydratase activase-related protein [Bacillota bacterium]
MKKIGVPRALFYYYYKPAIKTFFEKLDYEVIISPKTNKEILDDGIKLAVDDLCLPFKVYFGHVKYLLNKVDYIFIPKLISFNKNNRFCPKFMGLPDMIRSIFPQKYKKKIIAPDIIYKEKFFPFHDIALKIGGELNKNRLEIEKAYFFALKEQRKFEKGEKNLRNNFKRNLNVLVLGHKYLISDDYLNLGLWEKLKKYKVGYITSEMLFDNLKEKAAKYQKKDSFWYFNRQIMGTAYYYLYEAPQEIDGIIQINAFGCGPDSLIKELIDLKAKKSKNISVLNINLDEHSGKEGFYTRIEAFIDLLQRKKVKEA